MTTAQTPMQPQPESHPHSESQPQGARPAQPQPPARAETVAVLGGTTGFPIVRNLLRAGIPVRAWNRSADKAEPLALEGACIAASPAEAARGAGIVLTILADEGAVLTAMEGPYGALSAMPGPNGGNGGNRMDDPDGHPHALWLQMSTIGETPPSAAFSWPTPAASGSWTPRSWAPGNRLRRSSSSSWNPAPRRPGPGSSRSSTPSVTARSARARRERAAGSSSLPTPGSSRSWRRSHRMSW